MIKGSEKERRFALVDRDQQSCDYSGNAPDAAALRSGIYSPEELEELAKMIREGQKKGTLPTLGIGVAISGALVKIVGSVQSAGLGLALLT